MVDWAELTEGSLRGIDYFLLQRVTLPVKTKADPQ